MQKNIILGFYPAYDAYADLVEQIERDGDEKQRHQVRRGDDGGYRHNDYE